MLEKNKPVFSDFSNASSYEWLETNGLGGWAGSSLVGANTRRYHGLLVAAIDPPALRVAMLSKLDETVVTKDERIELGANLYPGNTIHPQGHQFIKRFTRDLFPQWDYEAGGVGLRKTIAMVHGENTTLVLYTVTKASSPFVLELLPLVSARGYHSLNHIGPHLQWDAEFNDGVFHNKPDGVLDIFISVPGSKYSHAPRWFSNFQYSVEKYRGLDFEEDLFNHGVFSIELKEGDSLGVIISTDDPTGRDVKALFQNEKQRKNSLLKEQPADDTLRQLVLAADQFIVKRGEDLKTIIAGYHWFADWGRDTMISLPGLCLHTGRIDDARKILEAFARTVSMGMLPNRFQDDGEAPEYNNVDGTLWYFIATYKYFQASGDKRFVLDEILPVLKEIIEWHQRGTRYQIHVEMDGLLYSGEPGVQLTWMDAKIDDWVVTPRKGKAVEIQALWYNAIRIYAMFLQLNNEHEAANRATEQAERVRNSFNELFWNESKGCLYDVVDGDFRDASLRPNQLFAISLPFALIEGRQAKEIIMTVERELYTPVGLRSLPPADERYVAVYGGDAWHRDSAYHQGTVWSWLLGPYVDAIMNCDADDHSKRREKATKVIDNFRYHLQEACIGSISEIFDADPPHHPRGCVAQAWGVAEILRVIKKYELA